MPGTDGWRNRRETSALQPCCALFGLHHRVGDAIGASEPVLKESGIEYNVTFSGSSSAGVQAAVEAGLGIAVLSSRFICGDIVEWARGKSLGELPNVHQIARIALPSCTVLLLEPYCGLETYMIIGGNIRLSFRR